MRRILAWSLAAVGLVCLGGLQTLPARAAAPICSTTAGHVTVLVEHQNGAVIQRCVGISGVTTSGEAALNGSGISYQTGGNGAEVCQVDFEPTSYPSQCLQANQPYWALFTKSGGGGWQYAQVGLQGIQLHSGDALGLRYELGSQMPSNPTITCPMSPTPGPPTKSPAAALITTSAPTFAQAHTPGAAPSAGSTTDAVTGTPTPEPTPTGAVAGVATKARLPQISQPSPSSLSITLLLFCLCGGGLLGLLAVRVARR